MNMKKSAQGGRAKIFLISILLFIFSFYFADNTQAASCESVEIKGVCMAMSSSCIIDQYKKISNDACPLDKPYCCVDKTCVENKFTCEKAGTICASPGKGACSDGKVCCGATGMECAMLRGSGVEPNCLTQDQCGQVFSQGNPECQPQGKVCCNKKGGTSFDFTETECKSFGGYCYKWTIDDYDNCPKGETQLGDCDSKNQIYCCQKAGGGTGKIVPDQLAGLPTNPNLVKGIVENIANWLLSIIGILAVIGLVVAGVQYYLTAVDEKSMEKAKKTMMASIIGLVVALSGFIVIFTIDAILNAGL